ncbi:MAG: helix-turn-helix transcriptional regulator [Methyloceanibacter sp.]
MLTPKAESLGRFLRIDEVVSVVGLPRATVYEMAANGKFPKQVRLSPRAVGWLESEISEWQAARIAERDAA